jgi:RNA polymerase sigma factor (TIGR02999 family)
MAEAADITGILRDISHGQDGNLKRLLTLVYEELRAMARGMMCNERVSHTLQPTAIVHEMFLRLTNQRRLEWRDRVHFFAAASTLIRRILVDHARSKNRLKRQSEHSRLTIGGVESAADAVDLLALNDALQKLSSVDERQARIVELRYFGGLTIDAIAAELGIGPRTVDREWQCSKAWLLREMSMGSNPV